MPYAEKTFSPLEADERAASFASTLEKDQTIDHIFYDAKIQSYTTVEFLIPEGDGRELAAGRRLVFVIPEEFRNRIVRDVILRHRKGEKYRKDIRADGWDPHGAYSRVEAHDTQANTWRAWRDPLGYSPDKFAEPRSANDPEVEVLHDWVATVGKIQVDALRLTNVGSHETYSTVSIHGLEIVFFPEHGNVTYEERIYCPGTRFIDLEKGELLPEYGGGEHTGGIYKGALALNEHRKALYELSAHPGEGAKKEQRQLILDLEHGKTLIQAEVSCGDTEYFDKPDSNGRYSRLGWAKLWVGIRRARTGAIEWFIQNANIPPQGVIAGGPHLEQNKIEHGDQLIIESRADTAYIMGWRLAYENLDEKTSE